MLVSIIIYLACYTPGSVVRSCYTAGSKLFVNKLGAQKVLLVDKIWTRN